MNHDQAEQLEFAGAAELLHEGFGRISEKLQANPEHVQKLSDRTLLALAAWTEGTEANDVATAECRRRAGHHEQMLRRFTQFSEQLDLFVGLNSSVPWPQARAIIDERIEDLRGKLLDAANES